MESLKEMQQDFLLHLEEENKRFSSSLIDAFRDAEPNLEHALCHCHLYPRCHPKWTGAHRVRAHLNQCREGLG